jgi:hypothetical protein
LANAYCTVAEANGLLPATMLADLRTPEYQIPLADALIWATRLIEEQVDWYWPPLTLTQALSWPLDGARDGRGRVWSPLAVPLFVKRATAEYAFALLQETVRQQAADLAAPLQGLKSLTIDDVRMEVATTTAPETPTASTAPGRMPVGVRRSLAPYGAIAGGGTIPLVRS